MTCATGDLDEAVDRYVDALLAKNVDLKSLERQLLRSCSCDPEQLLTVLRTAELLVLAVSSGGEDIVERVRDEVDELVQRA